MSKIDASLIHDGEKDLELFKPTFPNWGIQTLSVHFMCGGARNDPFDNVSPPEPMTRREALRQMHEYVDHIFTYQHRTFHVHLLVYGSKYRATYWDCSGVIVTEAIEYAATTAGTEALLELLFAFSLGQLGHRKAGFDPTVNRLSPTSCGYKQMAEAGHPSPEDVDETEVEKQISAPADHLPSVLLYPPQPRLHRSKLFDEGLLCSNPTCLECSHPERSSGVAGIRRPLPTFKYIRDLFRKSLAAGNARYSILIGGHHYLVGSPTYAAPGPVGRGTCGFVALEWHTQRLVFLKDSWRPHYAGVGPEGATLEKLNAASVPFVPTLIRYEDVPGQTTLVSTRYAREGRPMRPMPRRRRKADSFAAPAAPAPQPVVRTRRKRGYDEIVSDDQALRAAGGLRHLTHSRVVVAEVCMPLAAYTNSLQLATVVMCGVNGECCTPPPSSPRALGADVRLDSARAGGQAVRGGPRGRQPRQPPHLPLCAVPRRREDEIHSRLDRGPERLGDGEGSYGGGRNAVGADGASRATFRYTVTTLTLV